MIAFLDRLDLHDRHRWGRPDITRFGMDLTPDAQRIWLDHPGGEICP